MATFPDSFTELGGDPVDPVPVGDSFEEYDESQRLDSLVEDSYTAKDVVDDVLESEPSGYVNGNQEFGGSDGPILPPPMEMEPEEGYALREWRRENAIRLEEKEKKEKELLSQIIEEAETYKVEFHKKREATCEANKVSNREKEKIFLANHEKFHAEADKSYWKAIAELIPNEVPAIEKRGKKDKEKKPSIVVVQGPKPGKPTDRTRMRQIIIKLKHSTPSHLKHSPAPTPAKDASVAAAPVAAAPEAVVSA